MSSAAQLGQVLYSLILHVQLESGLSLAQPLILAVQKPFSESTAAVTCGLQSILLGRVFALCSRFVAERECREKVGYSL